MTGLGAFGWVDKYIASMPIGIEEPQIQNANPVYVARPKPAEYTCLIACLAILEMLSHPDMYLVL